MGRTVKSSPSAQSLVGKFLKWFAASFAVSPPLFANFALVKLLSLSGSYILEFSLLAGS